MEAYTFEKWVFVYENGESVPTKGSIDGYDFRLEDDGWRIEKVETFAREAWLLTVRLNSFIIFFGGY